MTGFVFVKLINEDSAKVKVSEVACLRQRRNTMSIILKSGHELPLDHNQFKTVESVERVLARGLPSA